MVGNRALKIWLPFALLAFPPSHAFGAQAFSCEADAARRANEFRVNTPYQRDVPILDLDPVELCRANKNAPGNQMVGGDHVDHSQICQSSYERAMKAVRDYQDIVRQACDKSLGIDLANKTGQGLLTGEVVGKAQEAAALNRAAATKLQEASDQVAVFGREAIKLRDRYKQDLAKIEMAESTYAADVQKIRTQYAADPVTRDQKLQELKTIRDTTDRIEPVTENGQKVYRYGRPEGGTGLLAALSGPDHVAARRGNASTITGDSGYMNLLPQTNRGIGLVSEQQLAYETTKAFNDRAKAEITARNREATRLQQYATNLAPAARRGTESLTPPPSTGSSNISSSLPNPASAMALMGAGSMLSNSMNQQAAPGAASQASAPSMWNNIANAVQGITGSTDSKSSSFGGATKTGIPADLPPGSPKGSDGQPSSPAISGGATALAGNGDSFVSGNGDLPVEAGNASRTPAADSKGKVGEGLAGEAKAGRKRKGGADGDETKACPPGQQDCAALGAAGNALTNKSGNLGVPVVGASDPALNTVGALDNLFGDLPALDAKGNPTGPTPIGIAGYDLSEGELETMGEGGTAGRQGAEAVAPANSLSLFMRVRVAHEKALKKGSVALFHRKL